MYECILKKCLLQKETQDIRETYSKHADMKHCHQYVYASVTGSSQDFKNLFCQQQSIPRGTKKNDSRFESNHSKLI